MASNKPWLDPPSTEERARSRMWQGGMLLIVGLAATAATHLLLGIVWFGTVIAAVGGLFWLLAGFATYLTGQE